MSGGDIAKPLWSAMSSNPRAGVVTPDPLSRRTSGSSGSRGGISGASTSRFGFESFGSLPSLIAFSILAALYFEKMILRCVSSSGRPHMLEREKKVAAASNVSAVCLEALLVAKYGGVEHPYRVTLLACRTFSALSNVC
jgi:hypothetical protein